MQHIGVIHTNFTDLVASVYATTTLSPSCVSTITSLRDLVNGNTESNRQKSQSNEMTSPSAVHSSLGEDTGDVVGNQQISVRHTLLSSSGSLIYGKLSTINNNNNKNNDTDNAADCELIRGDDDQVGLLCDQKLDEKSEREEEEEVFAKKRRRGGVEDVAKNTMPTTPSSSGDMLFDTNTLFSGNTHSSSQIKSADLVLSKSTKKSSKRKGSSRGSLLLSPAAEEGETGGSCNDIDDIFGDLG